MFLRVGIALLGALLCAAPVFAAPHSIDDLLRPKVVRDGALSPDGKLIALAYRTSENDGDVLAVIDADRLGQPDAVHNFSLDQSGRVAINWVGWASETRLLVGCDIYSSPELADIGARLGASFTGLVTRRVFAIDADGSNPKLLFAGQRRLLNNALDLSRVVDFTPNDPRHVLMPAWTDDTYDLYRVDIYTGEATRIAQGGVNTFGWDAEDGQAALRYDANGRGSVISVYGRSGESDTDWSLLVKYRLREEQQEWAYAGDAPGAGKIYVRARPDGSDTENIYPYDLGRKSMGEVVAQLPGYDMRGAFTIGGEYAGAIYVGDRTSYLLADKQLQRHLKGLDNYFGGEANVLLVGVDREHTRMLLYVIGPKAPGDYYAYDIARANLQLVMSARPWLDPQRLAAVEVVRSPMRDGTTITSYLTRPNEVSGVLPLVVMPHGGPELRDAIEFDYLAQAFAAQGWLVLQPNFRGSAGYGRKFAEAGYRQWSLLMQQDITDAVTDLVQRGIADRSRIAIYGASYGGYAALAGAVTTPDLYRAAVSVAGVSDLLGFLDYQRRVDGSDSEAYDYWVKVIGDPKSDGTALRLASPSLHASDIRIPVLLIHGRDDDIVPFEQSRAMKEALDRAQKTSRLVAMKGEGHSNWSLQSEKRQIETSIKFLKPFLQ